VFSRPFGLLQLCILKNFAKIDFPFYFLEENCDDKTQPEKCNYFLDDIWVR